MAPTKYVWRGKLEGELTSQELGLPTIYDLSATQSSNYNGSWATGSWITSVSGGQYFAVSHYVNDGIHDVYRTSILDLSSLEYRYFFQAGNGSYPSSPPSHLKAGVGDGNCFEGISDDNYATMHVQSSHSNVTFDLTYQATTKPLINGGAGVVMLGASESKQWSLPACRTNGFLVVNNEQIPIDPMRSLTWYDRQWGTGGFTNWTWFGLHIPQTGHVLSIWTGDTHTNRTAPVVPGRFATVRNAQGAQTVCDVTWTPDLNRTFYSDSANETYPLAWTVEIPNYDAVVRIESGAANQLNTGSHGPEPPAYNGFVTFSGQFQGAEIEGFGIVEIVYL
jgi:predicted secreted hydrolase